MPPARVGALEAIRWARAPKRERGIVELPVLAHDGGKSAAAHTIPRGEITMHSDDTPEPTGSRPRARLEADLGIEFTTFSLVGRCERTGMLGVAIATSEMAVGSRCIHVAPNVGAVVCQASTNPRLGFLGLNLMRAGYSAPRALEEIAASDTHVEGRPLG